LQQGRLEGRSEGRLEGRSEGRLETQREFFYNLLFMRFSVVDPPLLEALLRLPTQDALALVLSNSREELLARLTAN
jgi:predicted transposase YdaD